MKQGLKVVAVILLVAGIGLIVSGVYLSHFIEEQTTCPRYLSDAERKLGAAKASAGKPGEAELKEEARIAISGAETVCQIARQGKQNGMLLMLGGLISIIVSAALLMFSRRGSK